jgi:CHAT domain-containing protein/tetratricopeptide (TPR) repeat protein
MSSFSFLGIILVCGSLLVSVPGKPLHASAEESYQRALTGFRAGALDQSLMEVRRAAAIWGVSPNTEWHWAFRLLEAEILFEQAQDRRVHELLEPEAGGWRNYPRLRMRRLLMLARLALRRSDFDPASSLLEEARTLAGAQEFAGLHAEIEVFRGQMLWRQNRLDEAERSLRTAQRLAAESGDRFQQARAANGLGLIEWRRSRCDESLPYFYQSLELSRSLAGQQNVTDALVSAANNLGMCYSALGDFDKALEYRQQALRLIKPGSGARMAEVLGETGRLYLDQQQPKQAIPYFRQALEISKRFNFPSESARSASNLASALADVGDWDGAEQMNREALNLKSDPRSVAFMQLNNAAIATGRGDLDAAREIYENTIAKSPDNPVVVWQAYARLADLFLAAGKWDRASQSFEAGIRVVEQNRSELNGTEHRITFLARLIRFYQSYVDALVDQDRPIRALEVADSSRARILAEGLSVKTEPGPRARGAEALKTMARRSNSVWLSYWVAPRRSFLWVVSQGDIRTFVLPPAAEIADAVERYRGFIETSVRDPLQNRNEAGNWLYEQLIGPARPLIPAGSRVVIVPDGPLHQLNFETLPVYEGRPRYWIEDVAVAIAPSFGVCVRQAQARGGEPRAVLVIGDPDPAVPEFPKLTYAAAEVANVRRRFPGSETTVITGHEAQPGAYLTSQPERYSLIHIAAHAEANRRSPLDSAVILSPGARGFKLYARDVMQAPLRADLVTISACRSSGARAYAGEGLVGLARAFLQAGAGSVIAGLWDVSDRSTSEIMDRMYDQIGAGMHPAESLREAKLSFIRSTQSKPYYWGAFQIYTRRPLDL